MEEKKNRKPHSIQWMDRRQGSVQGVTDVLSFDEHAVILQTEQGILTIKGKGLHIGRLMLEQGVVDLEGMPESIVYSGSAQGAKGTLLKRMFR